MTSPNDKEIPGNDKQLSLDLEDPDPEDGAVIDNVVDWREWRRERSRQRLIERLRRSGLL